MKVSFSSPDIERLRKKYMLVDMHFHTQYSHDCSTKVEKIIHRAQQLGVYVAGTDHNSIRGVLAAHKIKPGIVKPGIEITTKEGKDILVYFYSVSDLERFFNAHVKRFVKNKSSMRGSRTGIRTQQLLEKLSRERCVVGMAHPFAVGMRRSYLFFKRRPELTRYIDAIEVVNQALPHKNNLLAIGLGMEEDKTLIGGSDGHILKMLGSAFTISKAGTWTEFLDNVKAGKVKVVGERKKLRHHLVNMARILREKTKVIQNRRMRKAKV